MTSTLSLALWVALGAASPQVLVVPYQASGVEDAEVARLGAALRGEVGKHGWVPLDEAAAQKQSKAAGMCGEDAECLATLGQRAGAQWVLAFSIGQVSKGVLASTVLVEVSSGQRRSGSIEKMVTIPEDFTNVARLLVDPLFRDVPGAVVLTPGAPPPPPMVVAQPSSKLGPAGVGLLIGGGLAGAGGAALSIAAGFNYASLQGTNPIARPTADATQRGLNLAADITVGVAIAALATGAVLLIADAASAPKPQPEEKAEAAP